MLSVTAREDSASDRRRVPQGFPDVRWPTLRVRDVDGVFRGVQCFLLAYVESVFLRSNLAQKQGTTSAPARGVGYLGRDSQPPGAQAIRWPAFCPSLRDDKAGAKTPLAWVRLATMGCACCS